MSLRIDRLIDEEFLSKDKLVRLLPHFWIVKGTKNISLLDSLDDFKAHFTFSSLINEKTYVGKNTYLFLGKKEKRKALLNIKNIDQDLVRYRKFTYKLKMIFSLTLVCKKFPQYSPTSLWINLYAKDNVKQDFSSGEVVDEDFS